MANVSKFGMQIHQHAQMEVWWMWLLLTSFGIAAWIGIDTGNAGTAAVVWMVVLLVGVLARAAFRNPLAAILGVLFGISFFGGDDDCG